MLLRCSYHWLNMVEMKFAIGLAFLAGLARTQTNNGLDAEDQLIITYGQRTIHAPNALMHPGRKLGQRSDFLDTMADRIDMSNEPNISTPRWSSPSDSAILMMIDLDAVFENTRVNLLHWLVTDVTLANTNSDPSPDNPRPLNIPDAQVSYIQPDPPVGDIAHTYQFYVFSPQPNGFSLPSRYSNLADTRAPFDLDQFLSDSGLGQADIVASNHFRVRNLAGQPTMTFPPPRVSETSSVQSRLPSQTNEPEQSTGLGGPSFGKANLSMKSLFALFVGLKFLVTA